MVKTKLNHASVSSRSPTLDTIHMVEKYILINSGEHKKTQIWKNLPKKTMYGTFCKVFEYLEESNKIITDKTGAVIWVHNPRVSKYYEQHPELSYENTLKIQKSRFARKVSKTRRR